jgi:hypothetical protein
MKNQDKPKMAMKKTITKVVVKPAAKMLPAKVAVKTTKSVVQPKPKAILKSSALEAKKKQALTQKERIVKGIKSAGKGFKQFARDLSGSGYGTL